MRSSSKDGATPAVRRSLMGFDDPSRLRLVISNQICNFVCWHNLHQKRRGRCTSLEPRSNRFPESPQSEHASVIAQVTGVTLAGLSPCLCHGSNHHHPRSDAQHQSRQFYTVRLAQVGPKEEGGQRWLAQNPAHMCFKFAGLMHCQA